MMSSAQIDCRLQAHADVKPTSFYQRNNRGPAAAPAKVQSTIVPPYQTATKGRESSVQCTAYAIALTPPAARPAKAPARARFVGAPCRTAQMETAKGRIAMTGMETRHSSDSSPTIILFQCELGASPRLIAASAMIARNGKAARYDRGFRSPPGRASFAR